MINRNANALIPRRIGWLGGGFMIALGIIIIRLFLLQIYHADFFLNKSQRNCFRYEEIMSLRGAILDRFERPLATNRPVARLAWHGTGNRQFTAEQKEILEFLERNLHISLLTNETLQLHERFAKEYLIAEDLPFKQLCSLMEQFPDNPNIVIHTQPARYYPYRTAACHLIGYFRETHGNNMGLEQLFEDQLRGNPGKRENVVNARGISLESHELIEAQAGQPIITTINLNLQMIAEELFQEFRAGTFIMMDPANGDINVLLSRPSFDPNIFTKPIEAADWQQIIEQKPFLNRATMPYPPASIFKIITTAAALEENIITPETTWHCSGKIMFGTRPYHCHKHKGGHGHMTLENAIAHSCDIPFYDIGKRISIDKLAAYAHKFGLGEPTGIRLVEKTGLIPTKAWKKKTYGEPWMQGETLMAAIGQTYLLVTPLQMTRVIASLETGTLVTPRILVCEPIGIKPLEISENTRLLIKKYLKTATRAGTARTLNRLKDYDLFGKTGTAQVIYQAKEDAEKEIDEMFRPHGWFIVCARYKEYPPIVLTIFIEHINTSHVAVDVAEKFLKRYADYLDAQETKAE